MSKQFERGQKVWVEGEIDNPLPDRDGEICVMFAGTGGEKTYEYVDPATVHAAPPPTTFTGYVVDTDDVLNLFSSKERMAAFLDSHGNRWRYGDWNATVRIDPEPPKPASEVNAELLAALELSEAYLDPNMRPQDFYALLSAHGWKSNERVLLFIGNFRRAAIAKAKGGQP